MNTNVIIGILVVLLLGLAGYFFLFQSNDISVDQTPTDTSETAEEASTPDESTEAVDEDEDEEPLEEVRQMEPEEVIGQSADGHDIVAHHYGEGETELLFVGGTHAGYSGNTVVVAYELMDYVEDNPGVIPDNVMVTVIPVLNPDGLETVYGTTDRLRAPEVMTDRTATTPGRFNGNNVDLNRNFDCEWQEQGTWQSQTVSGGSRPFSEPEAQAIRDYVAARDIAGAVVWYSAAGGVYSSSCNNGVAPETTELTNRYANAAGYDAFEEFDFYEITGDMVNWFAKNDIPAISVLLTNHQDAEWSKNRAGIEAMLNYYAE